MKWFFCYNEYSSDWFEQMIKVAVVSAQTNTNLSANCIYDGQNTTLTRWLEAHDVQLHYRQVPFHSRLFSTDVVERNNGTAFRPEAACGYYLPLLISELKLVDEYILYTDCDVMFLKDVDLRTYRPNILAAAPEIKDMRDPYPGDGSNGFNSGVILINVLEFRRHLPILFSCLEDHGYFSFPKIQSIYDQGLLNYVFTNNWDQLPPILNWRVFFGINPDARIVHWHGPKPINAARILQSARQDISSVTPEIEFLLNSRANSYRYYYDLFAALLDQAG